MNYSFVRATFSALALSALSIALPAQAAEEASEWKLGGAIRARYDYTAEASNLGFDTAWVSLNYNSPTWFGAAQYRVYQYYGHLGDTNYLTYGYAGYKIDDTQRVFAGLQKVPFGLQPYFGTTFYESIANPLGVEDVFNLGVKYEYQGDGWAFQGGFYPQDGGSWTGHSADSARYSVNLVRADGPDGVNNEEKNLFMGRVTRKIQHTPTSVSEIGVSALRSTVRNEDTGQDGDRTALAVHYTGSLGPWGTQLLAAQLDTQPKNPGGNNDIVTVGAFDGSFNAATKGKLYVAEVNYQLSEPIWQLEKIKLYTNYSLFDKDKAEFKDSSRLIVGSSFNFQKLSIAAELLVGKHDPYIGTDYVHSLAEGAASNSWTKHFYVNIGYYF